MAYELNHFELKKDKKYTNTNMYTFARIIYLILIFNLESILMVGHHMITVATHICEY